LALYVVAKTKLERRKGRERRKGEEHMKGVKYIIGALIHCPKNVGLYYDCPNIYPASDFCTNLPSLLQPVQ